MRTPAAEVLTLKTASLQRLERLIACAAPKRPVQTAFVIAAYDPSRTVNVLSAVLRQVGSSFPSAPPVLVVANSESVGRALRDCSGRGWSVVRGSNAEAEFSAFDEGIEHVTRHFDPHSIVFLNDRALSYGASTLRHFTSATIRMVEDLSVAVGVIDRLPARTRTADRFAYLRTHCFAVPVQGLGAAARVRTLTADDLAAALPYDYRGPDWYTCSSLSEPYGRYLTEWLTGEGTGPAWYRAAPLTEGTWHAMRSKLRSILYEHSLSAHLEKRGIALLPAVNASLPASLESPQRETHVSAWRTAPGNRGLFQPPRTIRLRIHRDLALQAACRAVRSSSLRRARTDSPGRTPSPADVIP